MASKEVIVTVVGKNRAGVLSEVTTAIAELKGNIMDISQKMIKDYFNLIMIVNISKIKADFAAFKRELEKLGKRKGYKLNVQHEKVFHYMHRI
jgi:ACT domain-containing protein